MTALDDPQAPAAPAAQRRAVTPVRVLGVLTVVAALAALWLGARWLLALGDDGLAFAATRDSVLLDARQAAINLNTLDSRTVEGGLDLWERTATGPLLEEFRANRAEYAAAVSQSRRSTEATVTDAAVAELDPRAGTARVLVGLDVTVRPEGGQPVVTRERLQLEMTRTEHGWKASRLAPVRNPTS